MHERLSLTAYYNIDCILESPTCLQSSSVVDIKCFLSLRRSDVLLVEVDTGIVDQNITATMLFLDGLGEC